MQPKNSAKASVRPSLDSVRELLRRRKALSQHRRLARQSAEVLSGFTGFESALESELKPLRKTRAALHAAAPESQRFQLDFLNQCEARINQLRDEAVRVAQSVVTNGDLSRLNADALRNIVTQRLEPLIRKDELRRDTLRCVQGRLVETRENVGAKCAGQVTEALVRIIHHLNDVAADSTNPLAGLWRFLGSGHSIWLYHHSPDKKWECLFFRIEVTRLRDALYFSMESYVPFGMDLDPGQYKMGSSQLFARDGWEKTEQTMVNFSWTDQTSSGEVSTITRSESTGNSFAKSRSILQTTGTTEMFGESLSKNITSSHTTGWFDSVARSRGGSAISSGQLGINGGHSDSGGRNGSETVTDGQSYADSSSQSDMKSTGSQEGEAETVNNQSSETRADAISIGDSRLRSETLQGSTHAWGIDWSVPAREHLERWMDANDEAARVYRKVRTLFNTMTDKVIETLEYSAVHETIDPRSLADRRDEISGLILTDAGFIQQYIEEYSPAARNGGPAVRSITQSGGIVQPNLGAARALQRAPLSPPAAPKRLGGNTTKAKLNRNSHNGSIIPVKP